MTLDMCNTDKLADFRQDAMRLGIDVVPPSVSSSFRPFEVGENRIFYSLAALKGVGDAAVEHIVEKRRERPFSSLADFCERVDPRVVGKRVFESLIAAGALDCFGHERGAMMAGVERMMGMAQRAQENAMSGQADIFGMATTGQAATLHLPAADAWLPADKLHREFQAVGFYLSAHPLDEYKAALAKMRVQNWAEFSAAVKRGATAGRLAGTVTSKQERKTRTGNKMGVVQFSDTTGQYEAVLFSEALAQYRDILEAGRSVVITVAAEDRPEGVNLRIQTVQLLDDVASQVQKALRVYVRDTAPLGTLAAQLSAKGRGAGEPCRDQGRRRGRGRGRAAQPLPHLAADRLGDAGRAVASSRWNWSRARLQTLPRWPLTAFSARPGHVRVNGAVWQLQVTILPRALPSADRWTDALFSPSLPFPPSRAPLSRNRAGPRKTGDPSFPTSSTGQRSSISSRR